MRIFSSSAPELSGQSGSALIEVAGCPQTDFRSGSSPPLVYDAQAILPPSYVGTTGKEVDIFVNQTEGERLEHANNLHDIAQAIAEGHRRMRGYPPPPPRHDRIAQAAIIFGKLIRPHQ